jgi:hypothetical protein
MDLISRLDLQPIGDHFVPPTNAYLVALEEAVGAALPPSYRAFLGQYGVCACADYTSFGLVGGSRVDLNIFLGSDPDDSYDILETLRGLSDRLPPKQVPLAFDPFGNAVCIDLGTQSYGHITYWDHETEHLSPVAQSFDKFLGLLRRDAS